MKKKSISPAIISSVISALLFLSACEDQTQIAGRDRPVTLVISSRLYTPVSEQKFLYDEIFPEFEEKNNAVVKFEILDDEVLLERAALQMETGRITSDIVIVHNSRMKEWIDGSYIEPLPVEQWPGRTFSQAFLDSIAQDGKTYFAPVGGDVYLTLANKKALPYLPENIDIQKLTWEEYSRWAVAVAQGEGEGKVAVTGVPQKSFIYMAGALILSYGGSFPQVASEEALKGWEILASMGKSFYQGLMTCDNVSIPMKSGEAWLAVAHMARVGEVYRNAPDDFILAPAPGGPAGIGSIAGTSGFAVLKGAENREMAYRFIEFMTKPEIAVKVARGTGGFLPPINEAIEELGDSPTDEVIKKGIVVLQNGVVSGVPGGDYTSWGAVKQIYDDIFQNMILESGSVDRDLLKQAQLEMDSLRK